MQALSGARLKLQRANKHISDSETAVISLKHAYVSSIETHAPTGGHSIKYECPRFSDLVNEIALITGDAIHNLRASLDHAWVSIIRHLKLPVTKWTKFPFAESAEALDKTLGERKIVSASPALFKKISAEVQPYRGGNALLWALHDADIADKHKLLIPLVDYMSVVDLSVEDEHGPVTGNTLPRRGSNGIFYVDFAPNIKIHSKGQIVLSVLFDEGTALEDMGIPDELHALSRVVEQTMTGLECL